MNEGQAPVNFFTINWGNNTPDDYNMFNDSTGATTTENTIQQNINPGIKSESLDSQLKETWMQIDNQMSQESKQAFVDSLSQSQYERMLEFKNAWYSFEASKSLLEQTMGVKGWWYRGEGFQLNEPVGGKNSIWNNLNPIGRLTEMIDDLIQKIPDVDIRWSRSEELRKKLENLTPEQRAQYEKEFESLSDWWKSWYGNVYTYTEEQNKSFLDQLFWAEADLDYWKNGPNTASQLLNIPGSFLKTASATLRWFTNPVDTMVMLKDLIATEEGREILKQRYWTLEGFAEALEKDPTWVASDALAVAEVGAGAVGWTAKASGTVSRLAGATRTADRLSRLWNEAINLWNTAGVLSDLNIWVPYEAGLNRVLGGLSKGNKLSQTAWAYLSMTQRPLRTIWKGANPYGESYVFPGIENKVNNIVDRVKDNIQTTATGLTPEVKDRIRNNPYVKEYRDRIEQMIQDEGAPMENQRIMEMPLQELGEELMRRLDEYEARIEDNGPAYNKLNALSREFNLQPAYANTLGVFAKNQISMNADGSLTFGNMILPTDMNPIQTAWNLIMNAHWWNMTARQYLNLRKQLSDLARYDSGTTSRGVKVIRELRNQVNQVARKEIPGLAKADDLYHRQTEELKKLRQWLVYQQGERKGQIRDNYYSILKNLGTQNRRQMAQRLENIYPDLSARVEAVNMLPKLAKAYQNSPQMMKNLFKTAGILGWLQGWGVIRATMSWLLGLVADELLAKPLGEKRRKVAIDELLNETSPEAQQKLAEIKSKYDAGIELTEQDRQTLALAIQEIIEDEAKYLDEKHLRNREEIQKSAKNEQPKLPAPERDAIGPDGTIRLARGVQVNNPETMKLTPKTKGEEIVNMQEELNVDRATAEGVSDSIEDFLDEIGWDINGNVNPRTVNYEKFRTRSLEELMDNESIPQTEKDKIAEILVKRWAEAEIKWEQQLDQEYAYEINKLMEQEQRIGKVGKNKVGKEYADKQMRNWEKKKEKLIERMTEDYKIDQRQAIDKYAELEAKPIDFINNYKKSKNFAEEQAERIVLDRLIEERDKQPKFVRNMDEGTGIKRQEIINNELQNGYERQTTDYGDRFINKETWDKWVIKYNDWNVEAVFTERSWEESGLRDTLPGDTIVRFEGETETMPLSELRWDSDTYYQEVWKSNPNERTITAEEWLSIKNFKNGRTVEELMDQYGVSRDIIDKIVTEKGEQALGRYRDGLVEFAEKIKEWTAPHELFHAVFDLVNYGRKEEILKLVMDRQWMSRKDANEWLADNFSEYFRTGKFDTTAVPNGFKNKVKWFFNKVKEFVNGMWNEKRKIKNLFDDMIENRIETDMINEVLGIKKNEAPVKHQLGWATAGTSSTRSLHINWQNSSLYHQKLDDIKTAIDNGSVNAQNFVDEVKKIFQYSGKDSEYITNDYTSDVHTLRISDHSARAWHSKINGHPDNNTSIAIKSVSNRNGNGTRNDTMQPHRDVNLVEFWYYDTNLTPEKMKNIVDGIKDWIDTGRFTWRDFDEKTTSPRGSFQYQIEQKSLFDEKPELTEFERYMKDANVDILMKTYDPDVIEWKNNLQNKWRKDISMQELYQLKNMVDEHIKEKGTEVSNEVWDSTTASLLLSNAEAMKKQRVWTYDRKQIAKVWKELDELIEHEIANLDYYYDRVLWSDDQALKDKRSDEWRDFQEEFLWDLGQTYNPDIEKWHKDLVKEVKKTMEQYEWFFSVKDEDIIQDYQLNNLKAKVEELSKYSYDDITRTIDWSNTDIFMQAVKPRIDELQAQGIEKSVTNLVALSNMDVENFEKQMKNFEGKSPMPSIAVMDVNVPHETFGDLTLVFGRQTVDPKVNEANKIYGSDAWTPMFPQTTNRWGLWDYDRVSDFADKMVDDISRWDITAEEAGYLANDIRNQLLDMDGRADLENEAYHLSEEIIENLYEWWYRELLDNNSESTNELQARLEEFIQQSAKWEEVIPGSYFSDGEDRPVTAENVLEAMKDQWNRRDIYPGEFEDMIEIEGHQLNDIEDVRKQNFAKVFHGDWTGDIWELKRRYDNLIDTVVDNLYRAHNNDSDFRYNDIQEFKYDISKNYSSDLETFKDNLKKNAPVRLEFAPDDVLQRIIDMVEQGKKVPIRFSESKPERIVDLTKEVEYILVPEGKDAKKVNEAIKGTPLEWKVVEYTPDNYSAPRSKKLKELQKKYWNVFFSMGWLTMPIAMLYLIMEQEEEGQA